MKIEMTDKQARVLCNALDVYSRIGMLQLDAVAHLLGDFGLHKDPWNLKEHFFDELKMSQFDLPRNASHGICSPKVPAPCKIAYDLQCVIRRDMAERDGKTSRMGNVWCGEPLHTFKEEPLAKVTT